MELNSEYVDLCWRCQGEGGYLWGDEWIPCSACGGGEFAMPHWFRRWRARMRDEFAREDWMARHLIQSARLWATAWRHPVGAAHSARINAPSRSEEIWLAAAGDHLSCSCDVFRLAELCLHIPAQEWVRRTLQFADGVRAVGANAYVVRCPKPVWGHYLRLQWQDAPRPGWHVWPAKHPELKFPTIQQWVDEFVLSQVLEEVTP